MITALGIGGSTAGASSTFVLGTTLTASLKGVEDYCKSYINGREVYTFYSGDSISLPVSLQKDGQNFTISDTAVVRFALVSDSLRSLLTPVQTVLPNATGNNWANSLVVCELPQALTENLMSQPVSLEVEVADGAQKSTFSVSGIYIKEDLIV